MEVGTAPRSGWVFPIAIFLLIATTGSFYRTVMFKQIVATRVVRIDILPLHTL